MMDTSYGEIVEPLVGAADADDPHFDKAVVAVAEMLAILGALVTGRDGRPAHGVSDEEAVLGILASHGRALMNDGSFDEALRISQVMERVEASKGRRPAPRRAV